MAESSSIRVGLNASILAVTEDIPRILTVEHRPSGLYPATDPAFERRILMEPTEPITYATA